MDTAKAAIVRAGHVPVDMEDFPASPEPSAQLCAQMVANCDVYLAVIGFRYGSPVRDRPGVSYTEFEFEQATALGLPRLVFLLDEDAEVPARLTRDLQFGVRQEAFRRRAMDGPTVRVFR